jgi:hypothetical protein
MIQAYLGKNGDPVSKISRTKKAGGGAEAEEHLLSKCRVLSSNPSTAKK